MDETLLRRLLGAAVLLAVAFVLAALLPDPRPAAPAGVVTYDLRTGRPMAPAREPVREAPSEPEPEPASESAPEPDAADPPARAPDAAATAPPAGPRPNLKVDETFGSAPGEWYVQVGSFGSQANARKVLQKLYGMGLPTVIQSVAVGKDLWYRVRVGPFAGEERAQQALATIRKQGYASAKVVRPETAPAPSRN